MKRSLPLFIFLIIITILFSSLAVAIDWSPQGNVNLKNRYYITNDPVGNCTGTQVVAGKLANGSWYCKTGSADGQGLNATDGYYLYDDGVVAYFNETLLNVTIDSRIGNVTYTAGTGLVLIANVFSANTTYFDLNYVNVDGDTMNGPLNFNNTYINNANYIQFNTSFTDGFNEGRLQWDTDDGVLEVGLPGGNVNLQIGEELVKRVTNDQGSIIFNGQLVYLSGVSGINYQVKLADKSSIMTAGVYAMATEDIGIGQKGYVTIIGELHELGTSNCSSGQLLWLGDDGNWTTTVPTPPDIKVVVGVCGISHATNGTITFAKDSVPRLRKLSDVISSPGDNEFLRWNGTVWIDGNETDPLFVAENNSIWTAINNRLLTSVFDDENISVWNQINININDIASNLLKIIGVNNTLNSEINDRIAADISLNISINNNAANIVNVNSSLNSEIINRVNADLALNSTINNLLTSNTTTNDKIDTEIINRQNSDLALNITINSNVVGISSLNNTKVDRAGDTITGDLKIDGFLNVSDGPIHIDGITIKPLDEKNPLITGPALGVYMTGPSGQNLPHLILSSGGSNQASTLLRSMMIVNEIAGFHNTTNATDCIAYMDEIGETLKIDCNTTTTGADLLVGDDMQVVGDVWLKNSLGEWRFMTRSLLLQDELHNNLLISLSNVSLSGTNFSIAEADGNNIVININKNETITDRIFDSINVVLGTSTTPISNIITYQGQSKPVLTRSTSVPSGDFANVARMILGESGNVYASIGGRSSVDEFISKSYVRWFNEGALYVSGLQPYADVNNVSFGTGVLTILLDTHNVDSGIDLTNNGSFVVLSNGTYREFTNIDDIIQYADGGIISNNKYYNLVCGILHNDVGVHSRMMCIVQNTPSSEYVSVSGAEIDNFDSTNFFPTDAFLNNLFLPVARLVVQKAAGVDEFEILSNGEFYFDVRGTTSTAGAPASSGIVNHDELNNLDYASSGHTGFASEDGLQSVNNTFSSYTLTGTINAWNIVEANITDLTHFVNADETDQVWTSDKTNYYTKTEVDGISSLSNYILGGTVNAWNILSNNITNLPTCTGDDKLVSDGSLFTCSADTDTTYSAGNGISLSTTTFSVAGNTALTQDADGLSVTTNAIGDTQLTYNTGQHLTSTSEVAFATINTGQGANDLYDMNQHVLTTSDVKFADGNFTGNLQIGLGTIVDNGTHLIISR